MVYTKFSYKRTCDILFFYLKEDTRMEKRHERYFKLMGEQPELFKNGQGCVYHIITDLKQIEAYEKESGQEIGVVFEDRFFIMIRDLVEANGNVFGYDRLTEPNAKSASVILAINENDEVVLMKQYRHALRQFSYEIPRGFGKCNLSSEENAAKELSEELNCQVEKLDYLGKLHSNTGLSGVSVSAYVAKVRNIEGAPYGYEGIAKYYLTSIPKMHELIASGEITDGFTLGAFVKYLSKTHS